MSLASHVTIIIERVCLSLCMSVQDSHVNNYSSFSQNYREVKEF